MSDTIRRRAERVAEQCGNAYSADRYRSWPAVAAALLRRGFSEQQAEAVMRSKWTRWAADASDVHYGKVPAQALISWMFEPRNFKNFSALKAEVEQLTLETFGEVTR